MSAKSYSFMVGSIPCTVLLDGASLLGKERILKRYPDVTEAEYRRAYADIGLSLDEADSSFNVLVAKLGDATVPAKVSPGSRCRSKGSVLAATKSENAAAPA